MEVSDYTNEMIWKICDNFSVNYAAAFKNSEYLEKKGSALCNYFREKEEKNRFSKKYLIEQFTYDIMLFKISGTGISAFFKMLTLFPTFSTEEIEETHSCEYVYALTKFLILAKI